MSSSTGDKASKLYCSASFPFHSTHKGKKIADIKEENCICEGCSLLPEYIKVYENSHEKENL